MEVLDGFDLHSNSSYLGLIDDNSKMASGKNGVTTLQKRTVVRELERRLGERLDEVIQRGASTASAL